MNNPAGSKTGRRQPPLLQDLTKQQIARKVGVTEGTLGYLLNGYTQNSRLVKLVCDTLEINTAKICTKE